MSGPLPQNIYDWEHMLTYLSGPMDFADDRGEGWRDIITNKLTDIGIPRGRILDPCNKPESRSHKIANADEGELMDRHRKAKDWDKLTSVMKTLAHFDLRMVDKSDFIIASFPKLGRGPLEDDIANFERSYSAIKDFIGRGQDDPAKQARTDLKHLKDVFERMMGRLAGSHVPTYGTMHEVVVARQQKKPVFVIWESDGMSTCSAWLAWLVGHKNVFRSLDSCVNKIDRIMHDRESVDKEDWLIFELYDEAVQAAAASAK